MEATRRPHDAVQHAGPGAREAPAWDKAGAYSGLTRDIRHRIPFNQEGVGEEMKQLFALLLIAGVLGVILYGINNQPPPTPEEVHRRSEDAEEQAKKQRDTEAAAAKQKADNAAQQAAKKAEEDKARAMKMGISLAAFQWGHEEVGGVYYACQHMVVDNSRYGGTTYWLPAWDWIVTQYAPRRGTLVVQGHDVKLKNGFGAEMEVTYTCRADFSQTGATPNDRDWKVLVTNVVPSH